MKPISLKSDCANCDALCCMALAFDRSDMFAIDKPAGIACPNLQSDNKCKIHARLESEGFKGCINYDCAGAGQRVSQGLFAGRSWRDNAQTLSEMLEAFRGMRQVHERLVLLEAALRLPLSEPQKLERNALLASILAPETWSPEDLAAYGQSSSAKNW
jgi:hypothetical protein